LQKVHILYGRYRTTCKRQKTIRETRYKCELFALAEGINNVNVNILEDGCPPSVFPFEITYVKPVKKSRNKPAIKEGVKIEKKVQTKEPLKQEGPILPI